MSKVIRKSRKPAKQLRTLEQFAAALKTPTSTVSGWIRHDLWQWNKRAPWPASIAPAILRWAANTLERGRPSKSIDRLGGGAAAGDSVIPDAAGSAAAAGDQLNVADLKAHKLLHEVRKFKAQADQAEAELAEARGDLHDADACEEEAVRRASLFRNGVQNIPTTAVSMALAHGLPHQAAPALQKQLEDLTSACLRSLAGRGPAVGDTAAAGELPTAGPDDAQPADRDGAGAAGAGPARAVDAQPVG